METITINSGDDVVAFLKAQHVEVKALFDRVLAAMGSERRELFAHLRKLMAVHETAEEEIVHPAARRVLPNGEAIVKVRLMEEEKAKKALAELEKVDVASPAFETQLTALKAAVVAHADAEEREEFAQLAGRLDAKQLARMKKAAEFAEAVAPTRPHPGIESRAANLFVGPFASMMDRARDALSAKS